MTESELRIGQLYRALTTFLAECEVRLFCDVHDEPMLEQDGLPECHTGLIQAERCSDPIERLIVDLALVPVDMTDWGQR